MMNKLGELLTRHRNAFLLLLLTITLALGSLRQQPATPATVDIPVTAVSSQATTPLEAYRLQRDQETLRDMAALEALIAQPLLEASTREDAATRLQEIVDQRQAQSALEGALANSSLGPCVVVIAGDSLTLVTAKTDIAKKDSALVLTLAAAHTDVKPENIRIMTAK